MGTRLLSLYVFGDVPASFRPPAEDPVPRGGPWAAKYVAALAGPGTGAESCESPSSCTTSPGEAHALRPLRQWTRSDPLDDRPGAAVHLAGTSADIESVSSSDRHELTVQMLERAGDSAVHAEFSFQLKQPMTPVMYQALWKAVNQADGLALVEPSGLLRHTHIKEDR